MSDASDLEVAPQGSGFGDDEPFEVPAAAQFDEPVGDAPAIAAPQGSRSPGRRAWWLTSGVLGCLALGVVLGVAGRDTGPITPPAVTQTLFEVDVGSGDTVNVDVDPSAGGTIRVSDPATSSDLPPGMLWVGDQMPPGTYSGMPLSRGGTCHYVRFGRSGAQNGIVKEEVSSGGPVSVTIPASDTAFFSAGCAWRFEQ